MTNDNKEGDIRFRRHSWEFKDDPKSVLIQYIGDESLAGPVYHGNCKGPNPKPRNPLLPSVKEAILNSPKSDARLYEDMRLMAGPSVLQQSKFVPSHKGQIKDLRKTDRKKKRVAVGDDGDLYSCLLRISQE